MVMASMASIDFNWQPQVVCADAPQVFRPKYVVSAQAETKLVDVKSKFAELPSAGVWADRTENDGELLEQLAGDWRDIGSG